MFICHSGQQRIIPHNFIVLNKSVRGWADRVYVETGKHPKNPENELSYLWGASTGECWPHTPSCLVSSGPLTH